MSLRDDVRNWICETPPTGQKVWLPDRYILGRGVITTNLDLKCLWCGDEIVGEMAYSMLPATPHSMLHAECAVRHVIGSVGHQTGRCECYGGDFNDPPGMSRREAALEAVRVWEARRGRSN